MLDFSHTAIDLNRLKSTSIPCTILPTLVKLLFDISTFQQNYYFIFLRILNKDPPSSTLILLAFHIKNTTSLKTQQPHTLLSSHHLLTLQMESSGTGSNNDPCVQEEKAVAFTPSATTSQTSDGYGPPAATPHTSDGYGLVTAVDFQNMEATQIRIAKARASNALGVKHFRVNKRFKAQIDEDFRPVERKIWCCGEGVETFLSA